MYSCTKHVLRIRCTQRSILPPVPSIPFPCSLSSSHWLQTHSFLVYPSYVYVYVCFIQTSRYLYTHLPYFLEWEDTVDVYLPIALFINQYILVCRKKVNIVSLLSLERPACKGGLGSSGNLDFGRVSNIS